MATTESSPPTKPGFTRRAFFRWSAVGAGVALCGGVIYRALLGNRPPAPGLKSLTAREFQVAEALAEAMFPPGGAIPISGKDAGVAAFIDEWLSHLEHRQAKLIKLALRALEYGAPLLSRGWARFSRLELAERERLVVGLEESKLYHLRLAFKSLKQVFGMGYFEHPGVMKEIGYYLVC